MVAGRNGLTDFLFKSGDEAYRANARARNENAIDRRIGCRCARGIGDGLFGDFGNDIVIGFLKRDENRYFKTARLKPRSNRLIDRF